MEWLTRKMRKGLRSKKQPAFDPRELDDLIFSPAVGTGVGSHLLEAEAAHFPALPEDGFKDGESPNSGVAHHDISAVVPRPTRANPDIYLSTAEPSTVDIHDLSTVVMSVPLSGIQARDELAHDKVSQKEDDQIEPSTVVRSPQTVVISSKNDSVDKETTDPATNDRTTVVVSHVSTVDTRDMSPVVNDHTITVDTSPEPGGHADAPIPSTADFLRSKVDRSTVDTSTVVRSTGDNYTDATVDTTLHTTVVTSAPSRTSAVKSDSPVDTEAVQIPATVDVSQLATLANPDPTTVVMSDIRSLTPTRNLVSRAIPTVITPDTLPASSLDVEPFSARRQSALLSQSAESDGPTTANTNEDYRAVAVVPVKLWVTDEGDLVSEKRVKRIRIAQDVINSTEESVYDVLWNAGPKGNTSDSSYKLVQAGYDYLMKRTRLSKKTIQRVIDRLIHKDFISIERPADIYRRTSTTYRVFNYRAVLDRHVQKGRTHVAKFGPGFSYVRRLEDPREVGNLTAVETDLHLSTVAMYDAATVGRNMTADSVSKHPPQVTIERDLILSAFLRYSSTVDDRAIEQLITACLDLAPDATTPEIEFFLREKGTVILQSGGAIRNPTGFLLAAVPVCFAGEPFRRWREERAQEQAQREADENQRKLSAEAECLLQSAPKENVWSRIAEHLKPRMSPRLYETWLQPVRFVRTVGTELLLYFPVSEFSQDLEREFGAQIADAIKELNLPISKVRFVTMTEVVKTDAT